MPGAIHYVPFLIMDILFQILFLAGLESLAIGIAFFAYPFVIVVGTGFWTAVFLKVWPWLQQWRAAKARPPLPRSWKSIFIGVVVLLSLVQPNLGFLFPGLASAYHVRAYREGAAEQRDTQRAATTVATIPPGQLRLQQASGASTIAVTDGAAVVTVQDTASVSATVALPCIADALSFRLNDRNRRVFANVSIGSAEQARSAAGTTHLVRLPQDPAETFEHVPLAGGLAPGTYSVTFTLSTSSGLGSALVEISDIEFTTNGACHI